MKILFNKKLYCLGKGADYIGKYWTSGVYDNCTRKRGWCAAAFKSISNVTWGLAQPNEKRDCVALELAADKADLITEGCAQLLNFICEVR
jgi:hypothetical protein